MSFVRKGSSELVGLVLDTIEIFGVKRRPNEVMCNCLATSLVYSYNPQTKVCVNKTSVKSSSSSSLSHCLDFGTWRNTLVV